MKLQGEWHPAHTSHRYPAELRISSTVYHVNMADMPPITGACEQLQISQRVGNIPRRFIFPDHSVFITTDNAAVDVWLSNTEHANRANPLHVLESRWRWVLGSLVLTVVFVFSGVQWGLPWLSQQIAETLPDKLNSALASGSLQLLDASLLEPSDLPIKQQQAIREHFQRLPPPDTNFRYTLHFRHWPDASLQSEQNKGVANALALPSGDIVVTDRLVLLAANQQELDAVLLHEIGHVEYRHSLRQTLQSLGLVGIVTLVMGNETTLLPDITPAMTVFLLENHYSQDFEREADRFALQRMQTLGISPRHFAQMMRRIANAAGETGERQSSISNYFSTHPPTTERIQQAQELSD